MSDAILEFDSVTLDAESGDESGVWQATFRLLAGQLTLLRLEATAQRIPLADAAQGIVTPRQGAVTFGGVPWTSRQWPDAATARGAIGRVFADGGWVRSLDLETNITLSQRHHTNRPIAEIRDEATLLARRFFLPGLPLGFPGEVVRKDLISAACVRAFLGSPKLIILEWLTSAGATPQLLGPLLSAIRAALRRGAAVLWMTDDRSIFSDPGITADQRATMAGAQFVLMPNAKNLSEV